MGNDGGSIPKRRELVKEAARQPTASELKATAIESQTHAWSFCPLSSSSSTSSSDALDPNNTVSDWRGRLYNYESVLRCLMPASSSSETPEPGESESETKKDEFARTGIKSLRDVVKLKFTLRPATDGNGGGEIRACPVSMKELGAATKAVYIVPCGHVFAEVAMREVLAAADAEAESGTTEQCPACSEPFTAPRDVVPVLPTDPADVERCSRRMDDLKALGLTHSLKKDKAASGDKKKKKRKAEKGAEDQNGTEAKRNKKEKNDISSRINNSMTASITAKVLAEQEEINKRRKMAAAAAARG
ncbi:Rtf2 RING-finger-domain-containing protein [Biscogniauxia mediterranea]|nr:Rtf2 RING-finger-domain-containing protein [Biscogniauxia mediterranea]